MRTHRARSRVAPKPFAIDYEAGHGQPKKQPQLQASTANRAVHKRRNESGAEGSFSHSGDEPDGDNDGGEEDEDEEDEDEDGDVFAPSDRTIEAHGDQTGLLCAEQNDSDDELYNAVDDISDSDADDPQIERLEENDIIRSEEANGSSKPATFSGAMSDASDIWEGFDLSEPFLTSQMPYFDEEAEQFPSFLDDQMDLSQVDGALDDAEALPSLSPPFASTRRRVHFDEPISGASGSSVTNDEDLKAFFNTGVIASTEADLDLDFEGEDNNVDDDGSSVGSSSGYETDYGDTTEEDDVPASATTRPQALIRQPSPSLDGGMLSAGPSSAPSPFKVPATPDRHTQGPRMGAFKVDLTRPFGMTDSTGDKIFITPAKRPPRADGTSSNLPSTRTSTANASPTISYHALATPYESDYDMSDWSSQLPTDPMLAAGSEAMVDTFFNMAPTSHTRNSSQASGSVFLPMDHMNSIHAVYAADDQDDDDDNDDEDLLNVEDFIDFGVDTSDDEAGEEIDTSLPTPISTSPSGAHARAEVPSSNHLVSHDLMANFDKGIAGVFRQGQDQKLQRNRRLSGGLSLSTQAFKTGRHGPVNSPASPPRKRKMSGGFTSSGPFGPATKKRLLQYD